MGWEIKQGDWVDVLRTMPDESVHCCVTSPPYWGLRDYGAEGQLGLEKTPEEYIAKMVAGFREVRRVLRSDGTLWLNMGDCYCTTPRGNSPGDFSTSSRTNPARQDGVPRGRLDFTKPSKQRTNTGSNFAGPHRTNRYDGMKGKDLVGVPWMLAFALRADGWWLRSDIIWAKPNPMPESVTDRPTKAHEYIFLLTKSASYFYDADAIKEPCLDAEDDERRITQATLNGKSTPTQERNGIRKKVNIPRGWADGSDHSVTSWATQERQGSTEPRYQDFTPDGKRNKRSVWEIATAPFPEAHFATFPPKLVEPCMLAGCPEGGTVLDTFCGAGTTGLVALRYHRNFIGIELKQEYCEMARRRIEQDAPLFNRVQETEITT